MSEDKPKTIQEALAEVQRKVNEERARRVEEMNIEIQEKNIEEGLGDIVKGGINLAKNFGRGLRGMNVQGQRVAGKFGSATSAERTMNTAGKATKEHGAKVAATAAGATALGAAAGKTGSASTSKSNVPTPPKRPSQGELNKLGSKPKADGKYSHTETTLKKTEPGQQAKIQSTKSVKGWSDPGKWENEVRSKTGSMQQIRNKPSRHVVDTTSKELGRPDEKSTQSFLKKQGVAEGAVDTAVKVGKAAAKAAPAIEKGVENAASGIKSFIANRMSAPKMNLGKTVSAPRPNYSSAAPAASAASSLADKAKNVATGAAKLGTVGAAAGGIVGAATDSKPAGTASSTSTAPKKQSFGQAFADARKAAGGKGGKFTYNGKEYSTAVKGEKPKAVGKLRNMNPKGPTMEETESSMIASFLELMNTNHSNIFEAAKHLSAKQKKIAAVAGDPNKIDAEDFKVLRSKKMEEESKDYLGASTVTKDKKGYVDPSTPKTPYTGYKGGNKAGDIISKAKGAAGMKEDVSLEEFVELHLEEGYDINDIVDFIEENYQLDEVSKEKLGRFIKKAARDIGEKESNASYNISIGAIKGAERQFRQAAKRGRGVDMAVNKLTGKAKVNAKEEVEVTEEKWIQKAIEKPGALHKQLHVPAGEKIPAGKLAAAAEKGGKLGKRARLAQTLKSLHKEDTEVEFSEAEIDLINAIMSEGNDE